MSYRTIDPMVYQRRAVGNKDVVNQQTYNSNIVNSELRTEKPRAYPSLFIEITVFNHLVTAPLNISTTNDIVSSGCFEQLHPDCLLISLIS